MQLLGFIQTPSDPCIYVAEGDEPFILVVHVDDMTLAGVSC